MASKTKYYFITAPVRYARVFEDNKDMGNGKQIDFSDTNGKFSVTVVLTEDQKAELIGNGVPDKFPNGNQSFKMDQDGNPTYQFNRVHTHKTMTDRETGERVVFGAPEVFDMEKALEAWKEAGEGDLKDHIEQWDSKEDGPIFNGSLCKVKYSVYEGKKGNVVRLEKVAVIEKAAPEKQDPETTDADSAYF